MANSCIDYMHMLKITFAVFLTQRVLPHVNPRVDPEGPQDPFLTIEQEM